MDIEYYKGRAWELVRVIKTEADKILTPILQAEGLSEHQAAIIMAVRNGDSSSISKLAEQLNANQGNFSVTCKKMEQMGLIVRQRSREDERVVTIELTECGEQKAIGLCEKLDSVFQKAEAMPEQFEAIITGFSEMAKILKALNKSN